MELLTREETSEAEPGAGEPGAPSPARPGPELDARAGRLPWLGAGRAAPRRWKVWARTGLGLLLLATVVGLVVRTPTGAAQLVSAFRHFRAAQLPWLALSAALEAAAIGAAALAQSRLLGSAGISVRLGSLFGVTLAANAVADLVPAGVAPASGWLAGQYRSRGASPSLAVWVVLASGFAIGVSLMGLLLVGAGIAGIWAPAGLVVAGAALVAGAAGFVVVARRVAGGPWLQGHLDGRLGRRLGGFMATAAQYRASVGGGAAVLAYTTLNWLLNAGPLVLGFVMLGLPVPWRALLFAYTASQVASGLSFLPSGLGPLQGGMVGGFVLAGAPAAPALAASPLYSAVAYWGVAGAGTVALAVQARHSRHRRAVPIALPITPGRGASTNGWASTGITGETALLVQPWPVRAHLDAPAPSCRLHGACEHRATHQVESAEQFTTAPVELLPAGRKDTSHAGLGKGRALAVTTTRSARGTMDLAAHQLGRGPTPTRHLGPTRDRSAAHHKGAALLTRPGVQWGRALDEGVEGGR